MPQDQNPQDPYGSQGREDNGRPAQGSNDSGSGPRYGERPAHTEPLPRVAPYDQSPQYGERTPANDQSQQNSWPAPPQGSPYGSANTSQQAQQPSQGQQPYSAPGGAGYGSAMTAPQPARRSRTAWFAVPIAAILAAALASGATYALTNGRAGSGGGGSAAGATVKINPSDYQNNNAVNWTGAAKKVTPSVVSITVRVGNGGDQGSGVVLSKSGDIVTNNHVVSAAVSSGTVQVTLSNNSTYPATIIGTDPSTDLAVIRIKNAPSDLTPMPLGSAGALVVGQPVMAVGNPLGLSGTVTTGIISALNRPVTTGGGQGSTSASPVVTNAIQTSAAINPGNSGGALVSASGKLIGINSSIATLGGGSSSSQSGNIGIGFAIPVDVVKNITGQLVKTGKAVHAQLGVTASNGNAKVGNATEAAAQIRSVQSGSAAGRAGLKVGDYITAVDGKQVAGSDSLVGFVRAYNVGQKIELTVVRGGSEQKVTVTLGQASAN
ncbi:MAG: trypsin-like peptidase domain-containing protein [Allobranchiibius sp.]